MKRLYSLVALMLLTTVRRCGTDFVLRGRTPRSHRGAAPLPFDVLRFRLHLRQSYTTHVARGRDDAERDVTPPPPTPEPAPAPAQVSPPPVSPQQNKPVIAAAPPPPPAAVPPPASVPAVGFATAASTTRVVLPPLPPVPPPPVQQATVEPQPSVAPPVQKPPEVSPPPAPVIKALHEEDADTPLGDWQTENKGVVRIAQCGKALCGYTLNPSSDDKGEAVLINMKPKTDTRWIGNVYSKDSGDTYYGTVDLKGPNTLHVEACALGRFYCSGNNWRRINARPTTTTAESLMTSRQTFLAEPRS